MEVKQLVPKRDSTLQHEMVRQQNNERMRRQFAEKANMVGQWVERHLDAVASISVQKGSLEDHRNRSVILWVIRLFRWIYFLFFVELYKYKSIKWSCTNNNILHWEIVRSFCWFKASDRSRQRNTVAVCTLLLQIVRCYVVLLLVFYSISSGGNDDICHCSMYCIVVCIAL